MSKIMKKYIVVYFVDDDFVYPAVWNWNDNTSRAQCPLRTWDIKQEADNFATNMENKFPDRQYRVIPFDWE